MKLLNGQGRQDLAILQSYEESAKRVAKRVQQQAALSSLQDFRSWAAEDEALGVLHKALKPSLLPPLEIVAGKATVFHPKDIMDVKGRAFQKLWAPVPSDLAAVKEILRQIRVEAADEPLPQITTDMVLKAAAQMKPKAGLGIDRLTPVDFQRLPSAGLAELVLMFEAVEATLA